jgi:hypothetical protein
MIPIPIPTWLIYLVAATIVVATAVALYRGKITLTGMIRGLILTVVAIAVLWFIAIPYGLYAVGDEWLHEAAIRIESLKYTRAGVATHNSINQPIVDAAKAGALNLADQGNALLSRGQTARQQIQNRNRALATARGQTFGDYSVPADALTWWAHPTACVTAPGGIIMATGATNSDGSDRNWNLPVSVKGWPMEPGPPKVWGNMAKVNPRDPYFSQLVRVGLYGREYGARDWHDLGDGTFRLMVSTDSVNCERIYFWKNDWDRDADGYHQDDFFRRNIGTVQVTVTQLSPTQ